MGNQNRQNNALCARCMRIVKWVPVLLIVAVTVWSYYAYVIRLCILTIDNLFEKAILLIFYHIISVLFFWSYWNTILTPVGIVPARWHLPASELEKLERAESFDQQRRILDHFAKDLPVYNRTISGCVRYCKICKIIKPDRTHHCSVCGTCILKMDHHCPWVNNCVNFHNYKYFVLFLGYSLLYCVYVALTSLEYFIKFWQGELSESGGKFHVFFLFIVAVMFGISLISLFGYHIYLILLNRTTLESFRAPMFRVGGQNKNGYNIGKFANFKEVFGDDWKLWLLPIFTSHGDGLGYPVQSQHQTTTYKSMGSTSTSFGDGIMYPIRSKNEDTESLLNSDSYIINNLEGGIRGMYAEHGFYDDSDLP